MLITPAVLRELTVVIKQKFDKGLQRLQPKWNLDDLCQMDTTSQGETILHWIDRLPQLRDWTGLSKEIVNFSERGFRVRTRDLELTAGLPLKELERGNKRQLQINLSMVVAGTARYKHDLVMSALYNNGVSVNPKHPKPDIYVGYDGVGLYGAHPINPDLALTDKITLPVSQVQVVNSQTNLFPTTPLSPTGWQTVRQGARNFRDPRGINLGVEYDTLIVPPQLVETAYEAVGAKVVAVFPNTTSGASKENVNATITLLSNGVMVITWPELDDGSSASKTSWYPMCRLHGSGTKPFEIMVEKELVFGTNLGAVAALMETEAILTEKVLFAATGRAVAYATMWFLHGKATVA